MRARSTSQAVAVAAVLVVGGCGPSSAEDVAATTRSVPTCQGFALSLASDRGGQPTPIEAVRHFLRNGAPPAGLPTSGWTAQPGEPTGSTTLRSGDATLHVMQGPDGTWQVDSGQSC